jgi:GAG-pre-integrase domain
VNIIPEHESLVKDDHLPKEISDTNHSAVSNLTENEPQSLNNSEAMPEIDVAPMSEPIQPHLIQDFESLETERLHQDYEQEESQLDNPTHELLRWHYKLGHESFRHLQWMAKYGILPRRVAPCRVPQCTTCYYGKASRRRWRENGQQIRTE